MLAGVHIGCIYNDVSIFQAEGAQSVEAGMNMVETWQTMMAQFGQSAHSVLKFAKKVPGNYPQLIHAKLVVSHMILLL